MTGGPWARLHSTDLETVKDTAFFQWTRHSSAALGTNGTLKTLGSLIFQNNTTALKKLDFGASHDFTTETTTFLAAENTPLPVEEVWFADEAPSTETLDNILALRAAASSRRAGRRGDASSARGAVPLRGWILV